MDSIKPKSSYAHATITAQYQLKLAIVSVAKNQHVKGVEAKKDLTK
jgi:hypothetical protein